MSLALSARQRDMLACMGLPMQGWPVQTKESQNTAAPKPAVANQVETEAALLVDTMNPAVRSMRLGMVKSGGATALPPEKAAATPAAITPAISAKNGVDAASAAIENTAEAPTMPPASPVLWSVTGERAAQMGAQGYLLVCESPIGTDDFPYTGEALALLQNILQALALAPAQLFVSALPASSDSSFSSAQWQQQIAAWQPGGVLLLGRSVCRQVLAASVASTGLSALREQALQIAGIPARVSYPLDYLLRTPQAKAKAWQDWLALTWDAAAAATPATVVE